MRDVSYVIGPTGDRMQLEDLPHSGTGRWTPIRKARVIAAVEGGLMALEEALEAYDLSEEEFESWRRSYRRRGVKGLRVSTRV